MIYLITGANRGIGLALTKEALRRKHKVIAAVRNPQAESLQNMIENGENIVVLKLDVSDCDSIKKFVDELEFKVDVLINNAGVLFRDKFPNLKYENFIKSFETNALGPLFLTRELYEQGKINKGGKIINIDSILGSISNTSATTSYSYSVSKAALNMITKLLSHYFLKENISVLSIHPGWVKTDMGGMEAPITPEESAKGIMDLIEVFEGTGRFFDYTGREIEW
ncbi:MAG: SDR family oxidoreductase [Thermosipho sp. (in: Bacteria)]|nr:SDR family oxidoreductase [Thermosipho sp. (in: thermotogales)]